MYFDKEMIEKVLRLSDHLLADQSVDPVIESDAVDVGRWADALLKQKPAPGEKKISLDIVFDEATGAILSVVDQDTDEHLPCEDDEREVNFTVHTGEQFSIYVQEYQGYEDDQPEKIMNWAEWKEKYRPYHNHLADQTEHEGLLYEQDDGEQEKYVRSQISNRVWTLYDADGVETILPGIHYLDIAGWFVTAIPVRYVDDIKVIIDT